MYALKKSTFRLKALPCALFSALIVCSGFTSAVHAEEADGDNNAARLTQMKGQIQSINEELSGQRANLGAMRAELVATREETDDFRRALLSEMKALRRQNQSLVDSIYDNKLMVNKNNEMEIKPLRNYDLQTPDGKMYFGEDEYVYVKEADVTFDARIDTGAAVSSISAKDITEFERNGKRWYRFTIEANEKEIVVEAPYVRTSTIRQVSKHTTTERVVVALNVKVGNYSTKSEFTLSDRTKLQYPLLIGRTLLQDIAVVDVSRDHIQGRNPDTYLILSREDYQKHMKKGQDPNAEFMKKLANEEAIGKVAHPAASYGANLGPNSENALPAVRNKTSVDEDKKPKVDANAPVKATPRTPSGVIIENVTKESTAAKTAPKTDKEKSTVTTKDKDEPKAKAEPKAKDEPKAKSEAKAEPKAKDESKAKAESKDTKSDSKDKSESKAEAKDDK